MAKDISEKSVGAAYAAWAPVYDLVFGKVFDTGRKASIAAAEKIGGRVLDVGVGTGISLPDYRRDIRLVGVDYSAAMLKKAFERVRDHKLDNVETLAVMDAKYLGFPDAAFDAVVAQYVITAVPDPEATLDDVVRVLKPGGRFLCLEFSHVDMPGLDRIYELYSFNVIPAMGRAVTGDAESYRYLVESIRQFPRPEAFADMIRTAGFSRVTWQSMSGGIVALHSGWRL